ncbi:MAG: glycoside hydrolase family 31 protein [Candidatus Helarchaeota archaeon]
MKYKLRKLVEYEFIRDIQSYREDRNLIEIICTNAKVHLYFLNEQIIRVRITNNDFDKDYSYSVIKKDWPNVEFTITEEEGQIIIITSQLQVRIQKRPFSLAIYDSEGTLINQDTPFGGYAWHNKEVICFKKMPITEHYYGFGEKAGKFDKREHDMVNWNVDAMMYNDKTDPLYVSIPFFIGLNKGKAYGIFFDNTFKSFFNMGKKIDNVYYFGAVDGEINYYFIYGPEITKILDLYTQLTGRPYFPPKWSLGYQQSKWSYKTESEVRHIASEFRVRKIPCDMIMLDIDFMEGYRVFTWNKKRFPSPKKLMDDLKELGFKIYVIVDPGIKVDPNYSYYVEMMKNDLYTKREDGSPFYGWVWPGKCVFPDFTRESVREWWGDNLKIYLDEGVAGLLNDMNEPSVESGNIINAFFRKVSTSDVIHYDNALNSPHAKVHNVYGLCMCRATREGLLKLQPNKRPFITTRSGFAGIQRYAAIWTGDNTSSWLHVKLSVTMLLNMGLSGVHFVGADIGGFAASLMHLRKILFKIDPILYARWIQLGVFYPFSRTHYMAMTRPQEPWQFGREVEEISRKYIQLRYNLMPYIYTLFYEANQKGIPIMRPLILEYQNDERCLTIDSEFLFGSQFLVVPITKKRVKKQKVYLPKGKWIHYWTKVEYEGPKEINVNVTITDIPIFVKGGSIIPMQPEMEYIGEKSINPLILDIYPDGKSEYTLYEDDGESMNYENGDYCKTRYICSVEKNRIRISIGKREGEYQPDEREYELRINCLKKKPERINFNGIDIAWEESSGNKITVKDCTLILDEKNKILYIKFPDKKIGTQIELIF